MKLDKIIIKNYRSIKTLEIDNFYKSNNGTNIFIGLNETGKSNILKAISFLNRNKKHKLNYDIDCNKEAQDKNEPIEVIAQFITSPEFLNQLDAFITEREELDGIISSSITRPLSTFLIQEKFSFGKDNQRDYTTIHAIHKIFAEAIKKDEKYQAIQDFYLEHLEDFESYIFPDFIFWKAGNEMLINEPIDLNAFKENPAMSELLNNIFYLMKKNTNEEIKSYIDKYLSSQDKISEFKKQISKVATQHINSIWKEHKINISFDINGSNISLFINEKANDSRNYFMNQRSDGFKQFICMMLTLSCLDRASTLKNNIILLDEPDIHLHPSGVKDMRDELINIGENNIVLINTHSIFMVDKNCSNRHWIVEKRNDETTISNVTDEQSIQDEEVMSKGFGLVYLQDLLPPNIFLVEGVSDKNLIEFMIKKIDTTFPFAIKPSGGDNIPTFAQIFQQDNIDIKVILDADEKGKEFKSKIIKLDGYDNTNVFLLSDLNDTIPFDGATLEDLLPFEYVKIFFENDKDCNPSFTSLPAIDGKYPCIEIIRNKLNLKGKDKKKLLLDAKTKLANKFIEDNKEESSANLEKEIPLLHHLVTKLIKKCNS